MPEEVLVINPRIGISGWNYKPWRGEFYPEGLKQKDELKYASRAFRTIEVNGTFYRLQSPTTYLKWVSETPDDFQFSIKASRFITHRLRAKNTDQAVANFFASGLLALGEKLGPILWQFPPNVMLKDDRFDHFLRLLPKSFSEARQLASKHDKFVEGRAFVGGEFEGVIRHAFEFRHPSFINSDTFCDALSEHGAALVYVDSDKEALIHDRLTANFVYARLHAPESLYPAGYQEHDIEGLNRKVASWCETAPVYLYFDNEHKVSAPANAIQLIEKLRD